MEIKYKNQEYNVDLLIKDDKTFVDINGELCEFEYIANTQNSISLIWGGKKINAHFTEDKNRYYCGFDGKTFIFDKIIEEESSFESSVATADREEIKSPMPGSIVKLEVEKGQKVAEGDPLIVVEAMKMETSLYASIDGVVTEVFVKAGEQVDSDKILMVVEKESVD